MKIIFLFAYVLGEKETMSYFADHFEEQLKLYQKQVSHFPRCLLWYVHSVFF